MICATMPYQGTTLSEIKGWLAGENGFHGEWKVVSVDWHGQIQPCVWIHNDISQAKLDAFAVEAKEAGALRLVIENANGWLVLTF